MKITDAVVRDDWFFVHMERERDAYRRALKRIAEPYWEMSHDKVRGQRDQYKKIAQDVLAEFHIPVEEAPKEMDDNF